MSQHIYWGTEPRTLCGVNVDALGNRERWDARYLDTVTEMCKPCVNEWLTQPRCIDAHRETVRLLEQYEE